jgi:hypothetical protein
LPWAVVERRRGRFIAKHNIEHFCAKLATETEPEVISSLHRLLVEEETGSAIASNNFPSSSTKSEVLATGYSVRTVLRSI